MKYPRRQQVFTALVAATACAAAVVTVMAIVGVWSGARISSRMQALAHRMEQQIDQTPGESARDEAAQGPDKQPGPVPADGQAASQPNDGTEPKPKPPADPVAKALARVIEHHLFETPQKPDFRGIIGVLGDRVLYPGGISVGIGESHNGATIKEIGSNWVKVEYEGEIIPLGVFGGTPPEEPKAEAGEAGEEPDAKPETDAPDDPGSPEPGPPPTESRTARHPNGPTDRPVVE